MSLGMEVGKRAAAGEESCEGMYSGAAWTEAEEWSSLPQI